MKTSKMYRVLLFVVAQSPLIIVCSAALILFQDGKNKETLCTERGHQQGYIAKLLSGECYFNVHPNLWATEEDYNSVTKISPLNERRDK